jgi:hypothetical protein
MFDSSAKKPAVGAHGKGFYWQPLGPYTCSLGEAGTCVGEACMHACVVRAGVRASSQRKAADPHRSCLQGPEPTGLAAWVLNVACETGQGVAATAVDLGQTITRSCLTTCVMPCCAVLCRAVLHDVRCSVPCCR